MNIQLYHYVILDYLNSSLVIEQEKDDEKVVPEPEIDIKSRIKAVFDEFLKPEGTSPISHFC